MRAALYARYSSDRQNERSIEDQLGVCRRHAEQRGWTVAATFCDAAISGSAMANRPGLQALLAAAAAGDFDLVLAEDQDRIARNLEHEAHVFNRLKHLGVRIATLTTDQVNIMDVAFKGLMNELYLVNLGAKTSRGMRANAERGLATGSRIYGYHSAPGGEMTIVEAEAHVVRRVFADYVAGATPRAIADALNRERTPGPRGGLWNASTINGSPQRGNGLLHCELYAGAKVWNRMDVRKDPTTGKRRPVMKPEADWRRTPAEALRIVDQALWDQARARKASERRLTLNQSGNRRKPGIFTGLLRCGQCGRSYTVSHVGWLACAGNREKGASACSNRRTVRRAEVEARVLDGLRSRLMAPEAVAAYVRAYHAAWAAEDASRRDRRRPLERRVAELGRSIERLVDAICEGAATPAMKERLVAQEDERGQLQAQLAAWDADHDRSPIALHPKAAEAYAGLIDRLQAHLAEISADPAGAGVDDRQALELIRQLVIKIDITPQGPAKTDPVELTLHGDLARFITPPAAALAGTSAGRRSQVVAGARYSLAPRVFPFEIRMSFAA